MLIIQDFDSAFASITFLGVLVGIILFMREELNMKGITIFAVIALVILGNYITSVYGLN